MAFSSCSDRTVENARLLNNTPSIFPDYTCVTIPVNIAPMNFAMEQDGYDAISATFLTQDGKSLVADGEESIDIDADEWHSLLQESKGTALSVTVSARKNGQWETYKEFPMYVSPDTIDYSITYRLMSPGYQTFSKVDICQRTLSDLEEHVSYANTEVTNSCVNCHSFCNGDPNRQSLHIRGSKGATIIVRDGKATAYNTAAEGVNGKATYPYWHPSGRYIAYSSNIPNQSFHTNSVDKMDTYDLQADLYVYDLDRNEMILKPELTDSAYFFSNPMFSPDGKTLFFCRAEAKAMPRQMSEVRYELLSISFDENTATFGDTITTVLSLIADSASVSMPRMSSDGRFLVYCRTDFGGIPVCHHESDLWMLDMQTGDNRPMTEVNCPDKTDAFHNWSSTDRWLVFGSRRHDGMCTLPYFTHIDANGKATKPFLLPQANPKVFYNSQMKSYSCVEFVKAPAHFPAKEVAGMLERKEIDSWKPSWK